MSTQHPLIDELMALLPQTWPDTLEPLAEATLNNRAALRVTLVGAFSVGKSSLLNMLIGQPVLQTALQETTALPTFIEHGPQQSMQLISTDGRTTPLDGASFSTATTQAPVDAACAVLSLPLNWLNGLSIIDLPGLGGVSAGHQDYTLAQIRQADAVLYLLDPRGPSAPDLATLAAIRLYGKRVKVMVTRWDEVEAAVARGERMPSLEQWAAQIEAGCGLRVRLAPCDRDGLGKDEVLDYLQRAREDLQDIRQRRFFAELQPMLDNALGQNMQAQRGCETTSEERIRTLHTELLQRKQTLAEVRSSLHEQQQQDRDGIEHQCISLQAQSRIGFDTTLARHRQALQDESGWELFGQQGSDALRAALADLATQFNRLSVDYGQIDLPAAQVREFNLRLPAPESIDVSDFLDAGRLTQLQQAIGHTEQQIAEAEGQLATLPAQDMTEAEQALQQLLRDRQQIASMPLPHIVQQVEGIEGGRALGRFLGEIADIGLMFVNPAWVGAKMAALVGKGAKIVNTTVKVKEVSTAVSKGIKIAQATQSGAKVKGVAPETVDKLKMLEVLSLGYWGERIGAALSGSRTEEVIDPAAEAEQAQALTVIESDIQRLRHELGRQEDIANERQLSGWALEQNRKERARLQADLAQRIEDAEQNHQEAQARAQQERQAMITRHANRAIAQWLSSFNQQSSSMIDLMRAHVRDHWEHRIEALVAERLVNIETLIKQIQDTPDQKQVTLAQLQAEAEGIRRAQAKVAAHG